jgi:hypothetical protein
MATKKQKREAALARREAFLDEQRRIGLEAQQRDREQREAHARRMKEEAQRMDRRMEAILAAHNIHESALDDGLKRALKLSQSSPLVQRGQDA